MLPSQFILSTSNKNDGKFSTPGPAIDEGHPRDNTGVQNILKRNMVSAMQTIGFLYNCVALLLLFFATTSCCQADSNNSTALFVFGDSVYDPGNNDFLNISITYKANFPPYGETFFKFPTGRFSDGRLIPDLVGN